MKTDEEITESIRALKKVRAQPYIIGKTKHRLDASISTLEWVLANNDDLNDIAKKITG